MRRSRGFGKRGARAAARLLLAASLALVGLLGPCAAQQSPDPAGGVVVRVALRPETEAVIGQRVRLLVDVLFPDMMPFPPKVAAPALPAAQVFRFETQAVTMTEQIGGRTYVGQRFEFAIYPRRGGELVVPPATVTLRDKAGSDTGTLKSEERSLRIVVPPGIDGSQPVIASTKVTSTEHWSPAPRSAFKTGDALKRTITRTAADVPGLAMRAFDFAPPPGVRVYVDPPRIDDKMDRGSVVGERVDRATYVFEKPGSYTLPGVSQPWWDLDAKAARAAEHPALRVEVTAAPAAAGQGGGRWLAFAGRDAWAALLGTSALVLSLLLRWSSPRVAAAWRERRRARAQSEATAFRELMRVCGRGEAGPTYRALVAWISRLPGGKEVPGTMALVATEPAAALPIERLERSLFGRDHAPDAWTATEGRQLATGLRSARRRFLSRSAGHHGKSPLPPLNPSSVS